MSYMGILGSVPDLNSLSDVTIITPEADQFLSYNGLTTKWENRNFSSIIVNIDQLADVMITSPQPGQVIMYTGSIWTNQYATKADRPYQFFLSSFT